MLIGIVVIMLVIIYIMSQNNKVQMLFDNLKLIDIELERKLPTYISETGQVDVFTLQEIRSMIKKDYVHKKKIDDFRIYKESMYKLRLILKSGLAVQVLEIVTTDSKVKLKEIALNHSDIELLND